MQWVTYCTHQLVSIRWTYIKNVWPNVKSDLFWRLSWVMRRRSKKMFSRHGTKRVCLLGVVTISKGKLIHVVHRLHGRFYSAWPWRSRCYCHFYEIFTLRVIWKKNHPNKAEFRLHEEGIPLNWYIFYSYNIKTERFFDTFTIIRMRKPT